MPKNKVNLADSSSQREFLRKLAQAKMPFGKYKDRLLIDLPEYYLIWYSQKGFPKGTLGIQMQTVYELQLNGLIFLVRNIQKMSE